MIMNICIKEDLGMNVKWSTGQRQGGWQFVRVLCKCFQNM